MDIGDEGPSPVVMTLSNDAASIAADTDGKVSASILQAVTTTTVKIFEGKNDITSLYTITPTSEEDGKGRLATVNVTDSTFYLTSFRDDVSSVVITITATTDTPGYSTLTKVFTVSKSVRGEDGKEIPTYALLVSPDSWVKIPDSTLMDKIQLQFTVQKYTEEGVETLEDGYEIRILQDSSGVPTETVFNEEDYIEDSETFYLYVQVNEDDENMTLVDIATVTKLEDSVAYGTAVIYCSSSDGTTPPATPTDPTSITPWKRESIAASESAPFIWKCEGSYKTYSENTTYTCDWTEPELYSVWFSELVNGTHAANYYRLFGADGERQGVKWDREDGNLYINASMINTGILTVTGNKDEEADEDHSNVLFSAGWNEDGKGVVYINGMTVGDVASKDDVNIGRNLATRASLIAHDGVLTESEYNYTIRGGDSTSNNTGLGIGHKDNNFFVVGKDYVISYKFLVSETTAETVEKIAGHQANFKINKAIIDGEKKAISNSREDYGLGFELTDKTVGKSHTVELYITYMEDGNASFPGIYIQPFRQAGADTPSIIELLIWDLKVEEGTRATKWIAPNDAIASNANGSYSWQFSPSQGIKMWNGTQTDENKVFAVDGNGLYMCGNGEFTGTISAAGGNIGGWMIDYLRAGYSQPSEIGLFKKGAQYSSGMAAKGDGGSVAFWAGCPGGTPWEVANYQSNTGFFVTEDGFVQCRDLKAVSGSIGQLLFDTNSIRGATWALSPETLSFSSGNAVIVLDGSTFGTDGSKNAYIKSSGTFTLESSAGNGIRVGPSSGITTITATKVELYHSNRNIAGNSAVKVRLTFDKPPNDDFTLYWYNWASDNGNKSNESGSYTFTVDGSTVYTTDSFTVSDHYNCTNYIGFSITASSNAYAQALNKSIEFTGGRNWETISIIGNQLSEYSRSDSAVVCIGDFLPDSSDNNRSLGSQGQQWGDAWCRDGQFTGSDRNLKKEILPYDDRYNLLFDNLRPIKFKWIKNTSDRFHTGFIAQEVEEAILKAGLTTQDLAAIAKYKRDNGADGYSLRYTEFISLNTWQIQKLKPRVSTLEQTIVDYENRISKLETEIQNLKSQ